MTYIQFLLGFVVTPIAILIVWYFYTQLVDKRRSGLRRYIPISFSFLLMASIAILYTTPWDNYLVATRIWWYDPSLVLGVTIGWVPIEEYLFFLLQPILGGLILLLFFWRRKIRDREIKLNPSVRKWLLLPALTIWIVALVVLFAGISSATYLGLELAWAMPVIILQLSFGADILWRHKGILFVLILALTIYLSLADAYAIQSGVWTINPGKSLGVLLGGILPIEEFVFFLLTNIMVMFGFLLVWSPESHSRLAAIQGRIPLGAYFSKLRGEM